MKPEYDVEIDHYYFAFEYSDGELSSEKIDVNDDDDVIDEDMEEEYFVYVNLEDCTVEFYEQNDFDRETLKDGFEHLEEKINKFLTELKQARADREKQQGQEFSLEQKQSKGRCR